MKIYCIDGEIYEIDIESINFSTDRFYWFCLNPKEVKELNKDVFNFEDSSLYECESISQLAKVDFYDDYTFLVLNSLKYENGIVDADEFNIFLGSNYIVTVFKEEVKIINELEEELKSHKSTMLFSSEKSSAKLLYYLLDKLILNDYEIISKLENVADSLEINILKNTDRSFLQALLHLRHQVHTLRKCVTPLRYIGDNLLCNENGIIQKEYLKNFHKINDKIEKLMFSFESLVQYIVFVREALEVEMANKTNELVKRFTIIAMFFSPLTLITGIYGMNFNIPEFKWACGYLYVMTLMIFVSFGLYIYFKKQKWL